MRKLGAACLWCIRCHSSGADVSTYIYAVYVLHMRCMCYICGVCATYACCICLTCSVSNAIAAGADGPKAAAVNDRRGKCRGRQNDFRQSLVRYVLVYRRHRQTLQQQQQHLKCQDLFAMRLAKPRLCYELTLVSSIEV